MTNTFNKTLISSHVKSDNSVRDGFTVIGGVQYDMGYEVGHHKLYTTVQSVINYDAWRTIFTHHLLEDGETLPELASFYSDHYSDHYQQTLTTRIMVPGLSLDDNIEGVNRRLKEAVNDSIDNLSLAVQVRTPHKMDKDESMELRETVARLLIDSQLLFNEWLIRQEDRVGEITLEDATSEDQGFFMNRWHYIDFLKTFKELERISGQTIITEVER